MIEVYMLFEHYGVINIWTYLAGLFFIIVLPGPNSLYVLKTGASQGVKTGYKAATGVFIGDAVLIFLAYLGVASLIQTSPLLFAAVRYLGAFYLLYLGIKIFYTNFFTKNTTESDNIHERENVLARSLTLSLTNPKAILFYISFFVQFIDYNYENTAISYLILASILELFSLIYLSILIFCGATLAKFFKSRKKIAQVGNSLIGIFFIGFAARLASMTSK